MSKSVRKNYIREDDDQMFHFTQPGGPHNNAVTIIARWVIIVALAVVGLVLALEQVRAQTVTISDQVTSVTLIRGSSTVKSYQSWDECKSGAIADANARAATVAAGTVTKYTCQTEKRVLTATYASCPPLPAIETRQATCPTGLIGSWTQTRSYVSAPAPTCSIAGSWQPTDPPVGACVPPPDTTAPSKPVLTVSSPTPGALVVSWPASTDDRAVTNYRIEQCFSANCTPASIATLLPPTQLSLNWSGVAEGATWRGRICALDAAGNAGCSDIATQVITKTPPANTAPTISGTPATSAKVGTAYAFTPTASDAEGDALSFSIANKPTWSTFSATTGALTGTPSAAGSTSGVTISVSDGKASANLPPFTLTVTQSTAGAVTLSWSPPTTNTDNTPLTNLAGYVVEYGTADYNLDKQVTVMNASISSYLMSNLAPGTYYFAVRAVSAAGAQSGRSNVVTKTVQ